MLLANAAQVKNVPGRKTDVNKAAWLAELLARGLLRASFVPEPTTEDVPTLLRTRKQLLFEKASHTQRRLCGFEMIAQRREGSLKADSVSPKYYLSATATGAN